VRPGRDVMRATRRSDAVLSPAESGRCDVGDVGVVLVVLWCCGAGGAGGAVCCSLAGRPRAPMERGRPALGWRTVAPAGALVLRPFPLGGGRGTQNYMRGSRGHCACWGLAAQVPETAARPPRTPAMVYHSPHGTLHVVFRSVVVPRRSPRTARHPLTFPSSSPDRRPQGSVREPSPACAERSVARRPALVGTIGRPEVGATDGPIGGRTTTLAPGT